MTIFSSSGKFWVTRLTPGCDLRQSLSDLPIIKFCSAISIISCVGSLSQVVLRFANQSDSTRLIGKFEIVSLTGTVSPDGVHLHVSVSDHEGKTIGGHLVNGSLIRTTAEILLVELSELEFSRKTDPATGYRELSIGRKS
jgi:uncharacterized protein